MSNHDVTRCLLLAVETAAQVRWLVLTDDKCDHGAPLIYINCPATRKPLDHRYVVMSYILQVEEFLGLA